MYRLFRKALGRIKRFIVYHMRDKKILSHAKAESEKHLNNKNINKILVMCYGNIYRSPFIEVLLRNKLASEFDIKSAGFHNKQNRSSPERHIIMSREFSVDLTGHKSSIINDELAQWADIIIIMDLYNWLSLKQFGQNYLEKVVWLGMFKNEEVQIHDPYNKNEEEALLILNELFECGDKLSQKLSA